MNNAHKECLELLQIIHKISKKNKLKYTLAADSLVAYNNGVNFDDCPPIIYLAIVYPEFLILKKALKDYCIQHEDYSVHDHENTLQFDTFEMWFVKESKICFSEQRQKDAFYYGTRLVITPFFYVGNTKSEWIRANRYFCNTMNVVNARAVLKGKPFFSYLKLSPKRIRSNYYIRKRKKYCISDAIEKYGTKKQTKYIICPQLIDRDKKDPNSVPKMIEFQIYNSTTEIWRSVRECKYAGTLCYIAENMEAIINDFPSYFLEEILNKHKSHLDINGNTYLWRVQQIQIELLTEFDRICRKYDLRYNISFGTLLGAVRHGGFIPWDDDIDVTMPWEDYDKLDEILEQELDCNLYYYRTPKNEENNHLIFKHLERKGTLYTKLGRDKLKNKIGVFIDIFPMYPSANNRIFDLIHAKICRYWRTALWATIGAESETNPRKRKRYIKMAQYGNEICYKKFIKWATFFKNDKYLKFWIAMDRNPYKVPLVNMENYNDSIDIEFEGKMFKAPKHYEKVLNYCFGGDWRLYPSTRERMPLHNAIMDIGDLYKIEKEEKQ